ncbi:SDR family oxidoreductase, partial [Candidatus Berkelbacteria bacterium]|nr:SDR family oxidoreductase [Candidatus Berkelbacteria bacterium]
VLITGASDGIGRAIVQALVKQGGFTLLLVARRVELLQELAVEIQKGGGKAVAFPSDVTHFLQVNELARQVKDGFRRLDLLINAAGTFKWDNDPLLDDEPGFLEQVNFRAKKMMIEAFRDMLVQSRGTIVNIGSWVGDSENPEVKKLNLSEQSAYVTSMRKLHQWHQRHQSEFQVAGIKILLMEPGLVATEMAKREFANMPIDWSKVPTPDEFAKSVLLEIKNPFA